MISYLLMHFIRIFYLTKIFFDWLCVSFFDENLIDKPADFEVIVQELTKTDTLDKAFSSWPGDFTGNTEELESFYLGLNLLMPVW